MTHSIKKLQYLILSSQFLCTFASRMVKFGNILLSLLLSMAILFFGSGITVIRCAHMGTLRMVTIFNSNGMGDMSCDMNAVCMSTEHYELSPLNMAQADGYDFHADQPLLAVLPSLVAEWQVPVVIKYYVRQFVPLVWKSPPRDYLNFIQVFLI